MCKYQMLSFRYLSIFSYFYVNSLSFTIQLQIQYNYNSNITK